MMVSLARYPHPRPEFLRHLEQRCEQSARNLGVVKNIGQKAGWAIQARHGNVKLRIIGPKPEPEEPLPIFEVSSAIAGEHFADDGQEITVSKPDGSRYRAIARIVP